MAIENDNEPAGSRSSLDVFHFAVVALGFFVTGGGVVVSSIPGMLGGLVLMIWGLGYFLANPGKGFGGS